MGLIFSRFLCGSLLLALLVPALRAAPKLRLSTAAVGPVNVQTGSDGPAQLVEAYNAGDGTLSLSVSGNAGWLSATAGAQAPCTTRTGNCIPINLGLQTASLAKGMYTGTVTVSDPNAVDAPQTITVTVQAGGGVPERVDLFVAPNGQSASTSFYANGGVQAQLSTQRGGPWLSFSVDALGSFGFAVSYRIGGRHLPGMTEGNYNGSVAVSGSEFAPDNRTVPVVLHVTSQPIAEAAPTKLKFRLPQGDKKSEQYIRFSNRGLGALQVGSVTASQPDGQNWLSVDGAAAPLYKVAVDPAGLSPGVYQGSIAFASNAANGEVAVPVEVEVAVKGPPWAYFGGVVNNGTFARDDAVPRGGICALFGDQLTYLDPELGSKIPLVQTLAGATVYVNDRPTPLYYSSYGQINFQMPYDARLGEALVRVERDGQRGNTVTVHVTDAAPRILRLNIGDYGIIVNNKDGSFPIPSALAAQFAIPGHPAAAGDALVLYLVGMGQTTPPVATGGAAPAEPLAWIVPQPKALFGGAEVADVLYAGLTPFFVGLYQVNVIIPRFAPKGEAISIALSQDGRVISNKVNVAIQ